MPDPDDHPVADDHAVATTCRICRGRMELVLGGTADAGAGAGAFAPTCHAVGVHGDLHRCHECGTVVQDALPTGDALHDRYRAMRDDRYLDEEEGRRRTARRVLDLVGGHRPSGRLLDVGCGHGLLLDEARSRGYEVVGLELGADAVRHAREVLSLDVREEPFGPDALAGEAFDVVVLADVLEHLDDPVAALGRAAALLAPGGALVVITPDPTAPSARLAGRRWWGYLPAHVCLLPHVTLRELVAGTGLVIAQDPLLVRSFTLGYWLAGLAERSGPVAGLARALAARGPAGAMVSASLGDERVLVARRVAVRSPAVPLASARGGPARVHAVLPAYKAARTVALVASELPADAVDRALLVDDASPDDTAELALAAGFEVLVHPANRGYGANQKTCYARALLDGADVVVMVHGDNQYDPALVRDMVRPIEEGRADVVVGSRLLEDEAIAGGMPRWKWLGNRLLTAIENRAFGREFSEYHTGYRAFSTAFLRDVPFLRNSDDFVFDQEIFAQVMARDARVVELAIPTRYFLEASSVSFGDSVRYGLKTLRVLGRYRRDRRRGRWLVLRRPAVTLAPAAVPEGAA